MHEGNPLVNNPKDAKYRYDLIHEEGIMELGNAIINNDMIEIMDGIADLLYVLYGACYTYNLNPDKIINVFYDNYNEFYNRTRLEVINCSLDVNYYNNTLIKNIKEIKTCLLETHNIIDLYSILIKTIINTYQLGFYLRIDINKVFNIVHDLNMSKLCKTEEEAKETIIFYEAKYENHKKYYDEYCLKYGNNSNEAKNVYCPYDLPYYYKSGEYYLVKNKSTGKALKSIKYTPVIINNLL